MAQYLNPYEGLGSALMGVGNNLFEESRRRKNEEALSERERKRLEAEAIKDEADRAERGEARTLEQGRWNAEQAARYLEQQETRAYREQTRSDTRAYNERRLALEALRTQRTGTGGKRQIVYDYRTDPPTALDAETLTPMPRGDTGELIQGPPKGKQDDPIANAKSLMGVYGDQVRSLQTELEALGGPRTGERDEIASARKAILDQMKAARQNQARWASIAEKEALGKTTPADTRSGVGQALAKGVFSLMGVGSGEKGAQAVETPAEQSAPTVKSSKPKETDTGPGSSEKNPIIVTSREQLASIPDGKYVQMPNGVVRPK